MSELSNSEIIHQEPEWEVEEFYFGNANTPSWVTYRRKGEQIQLRDEISLTLSIREGYNQYISSADELTGFLADHQDCQFIVSDSYELNSGERQRPSLWAIGWKDLPEEEVHIYEQDKANAWK